MAEVVVQVADHEHPHGVVRISVHDHGRAVRRVEGGTALAQLWLFIVAPLVGAALSAGVWRLLADKRSARPAGKRK